MHVVQINFQVDRERRSPEALMHAWWSVGDIAEAVVRAGMRVSVIQACHERTQWRRGEIDYYFMTPGCGKRTVFDTRELSEFLQRLQPDVLHVHGLVFPADVLVLRQIVPRIPIFLQDHASRPPRRPWHWLSWRRGLVAADGVSFCARAQAQPFKAACLLSSRTAIFEIPECTSRFSPGDREAARRQTALRGNPGLLWVGHLNANKDPLTVLEAVSMAAKELPDLELWCCFGASPLRELVERRIRSDPSLRERVHLLGLVSHERIELLMRAADAFVSASHREGSGYSLIEALACGLPALVTDIPSFRVLAGNGSAGTLWPPGNPVALCEAILSHVRERRRDDRVRIRAHFDRELSFEAVGRKLVAAYVHVVHAHRKQLSLDVAQLEVG